MNKNIWIAGALGLAVFVSCGRQAAHDHNHEGHDHAAEVASNAHEHEHNHDAELGEHDGKASSDEIVLSPKKALAAGVVTETVQPATFRDVIAVSGRVLPVQGGEQTLVANVSGVVSFARPLVEGTKVAVGEVVMTISAARLQDGDPVERARIAYETAKAEYERAGKLVGNRIVSQKEFNAIRETYENARLTYEALRPDAAGQSGAAVRAKEAGYVKTYLVREGDYVSVGQPLLTLVRDNRVYLQADVPERHFAQLARIASANFKTTYNEKVYQLEDYHGRLLAYGRAADNAAAFVPVTFELDNPGDILPGSYTEVYLLTDERADVISLPRSALTEEQGVHFVYLQLDEECYRKQAVTLGATDGRHVEIRSGLHGGERVVTQGAIYVKLASASSAIPAHSHSH